MQHQEKIQQLHETLLTGNNNIHQLLQQLNIADQARILSELGPAERYLQFQQLERQAEVLEFLPLAMQIQLAYQFPPDQLASLMDAMHSDDFIDLYKQMPYEIQQQLLGKLSTQSLQVLRELHAYPEETAGALMSSDFITLAPELNMHQAIEVLRDIAGNHDTLYLIYIVDAQQHLLGVISLRQIIQAAPDATIAEVMTTDVVYATVDEDQEQVARTLAYYDFIALPVVDAAQKLVGIITYDDAMDIAEAESTEDILKSGAVTPLNELSLKTAPIFSLYQKRVFWLVILVFGSLLSGIGIAHFEEIIASHIVLVFFLPLLVGSGGNAGSQSATLMVRALATGDVQFKDWFSLLGRESLVALCLGGTMAIAVSILGYIRGDWMVAVVLALSMLGIVLMGCLIGMSLPFILNKLKLDPASASAPLVTSICDATGVIIYLFIASKLLF
ncbi:MULTISPECIES: magnesium transporter [unclassified Acinetobacter]|uniref:magnesium transporter n=1 Tax=unclassified Acinetobacter TaxID=196816 RepID=UPI0007D07B50|nr:MULTISPECIES: magnesium transporter [unclassified Acinetobacter]OAL76628.1 magnesium transporter [Acinetobacter sp. SFA]OAL83850.1 magnesium transporter [Acinetobacter sp. SFD]